MRLAAAWIACRFIAASKVTLTILCGHVSLTLIRSRHTQGMTFRKYLAVGGAAVVLGVAAIGASIVQAQTTPTPAPTQTQPQQQRQAAQDRYLAALAARLNVTVDRLKEAMTGARQDAGIPDRPARGPDGRGGKPGFGLAGRGGILGQQVDALASLFGTTSDQLRQELAGKTIAEVAQAHNKTAQDAINTIVTTSNQQIDQMASQRNLSAERVAELKQQVAQRSPELVNNFRFGQPRNRTTSTSTSS